MFGQNAKNAIGGWKKWMSEVQELGPTFAQSYEMCGNGSVSTLMKSSGSAAMQLRFSPWSGLSL